MQFHDTQFLIGLVSLLSILQYPDSKAMQINLTGFLNAKNARMFIGELWELLTSAQENIGGIPARFMEEKKEEIKRRQVGLNFKVNKALSLSDGGFLFLV